MTTIIKGITYNGYCCVDYISVFRAM